MWWNPMSGASSTLRLLRSTVSTYFWKDFSNLLRLIDHEAWITVDIIIDGINYQVDASFCHNLKCHHLENIYAKLLPFIAVYCQIFRIFLCTGWAELDVSALLRDNENRLKEIKKTLLVRITLCSFLSSFVFFVFEIKYWRYQ